jgi:hypothetical protein
MRMMLPFRLLPTSKDKELRSIVPRPFPEVGFDPSSTGEQEELDAERSGKGFGGGGYDDRGSCGRRHW